MQTGGSEVRNYPVEWHAAMEMPGSREAFRLLDSIVVELSGNGLCVLCAPDTGLVSDAHFVP